MSQGIYCIALFKHTDLLNGNLRGFNFKASGKSTGTSTSLCRYLKYLKRLKAKLLETNFALR